MAATCAGLLVWRVRTVPLRLRIERGLPFFTIYSAV
jgi:hypothetical protein